ncbi:MAG TPA: hypothetical protein VLE89_05660 [Chlamydiales bacterium]|nr:hypothetical protein [Chlamydiales bacterium]
MMGKTLISLLLFLCGCVTDSPWKLDGILAGDAVFDSTRLRCLDQSPLTFEMVRIGDEIHSFLYLKQFRFISSSPDSIEATFTIGDQIFHENLPLHEGKMRVQIPQGTIEEIILALHRGEKVSILIDDFEKKLDPDQFPKFYSRFTGNSALFSNLFKGPVE